MSYSLNLTRALDKKCVYSMIGKRVLNFNVKSKGSLSIDVRSSKLFFRFIVKEK